MGGEQVVSAPTDDLEERHYNTAFTMQLKILRDMSPSWII